MRARTQLTLAAVTAALTAALIAGPAVPPATAAPPIDVAGTTQTLTIQPLTEVQHGNAELFTQTGTGLTFGDVTSTQPNTETYRCVQVADRHFTCQAVQLLTGTVRDIGAGTLTVHLRFSCRFDSLTCRGTFRIDGTGGQLTGIHGVGTFTSDLVTGAGAYDARLIPA